MVTPKTIRGKVAAGVKPSFREALERTELKLRAGLATAPNGLQITGSPSPSLSPRGRGVDVSVARTWATDLVAAARRDAKFVPFRLLTGNSNPSAPMFAGVGTDEGRRTSAVGGSASGGTDVGKILAASDGSGNDGVGETPPITDLESALTAIDQSVHVGEIYEIVEQLYSLKGIHYAPEMLTQIISARPNILFALLARTAMHAAQHINGSVAYESMLPFLTMIDGVMSTLPLAILAPQTTPLPTAQTVSPPPQIDQTIVRPEVVQIISKMPTKLHTRSKFEGGIRELSDIEPTDAEIDLLREHHPRLNEHVAKLASRIDIRKGHLLRKIADTESPSAARAAHQEYMRSSRRNEAILRLAERIVGEGESRDSISAELRVTMIQARQHADRLLVEKENRLLHIFRRLRIAKKDAAFNILEPIAELTLAKEEVAIIRESRLTIESELIRLITKTILTLEHLSKMPNQQGEFSALTYKIQKAARIAQQLGFDDLWLTTQKAVAKCIRQFEKTIMNEEE